MDATRLAEVLSRHARDGLTPTALPDVSVMRARRTTEPLGDMVEPTVAVIAQGVKETAVNGHAHTYGPGQVFLATVDLPVVGRIVRASEDEPFLAAVLRLRPERIAALLLDTASPHDRPSATPSGIAVADASSALLDAVVRLVGLLDAPDDAAALTGGVEREVLWRLLTGPQGAVVRQIGSADSRLTHLTRAIRRIRDHYAEALRVEDLAALASMSLSSFHRHFRAVTSMTPIQYQKNIRLHEARTRLLASPGDVAGVGYSVGYDSPSQFSREYRRMFGVPPSRHQATGSS